LQQRRVLPDFYKVLFPDASRWDGKIAAGIDLPSAGDEDKAPAGEAASRPPASALCSEAGVLGGAGDMHLHTPPLAQPVDLMEQLLLPFGRDLILLPPRPVATRKKKCRAAAPSLSARSNMAATSDSFLRVMVKLI